MFSKALIFVLAVAYVKCQSPDSIQQNDVNDIADKVHRLRGDLVRGMSTVALSKELYSIATAIDKWYPYSQEYMKQFTQDVAKIGLLSDQVMRLEHLVFIMDLLWEQLNSSISANDHSRSAPILLPPLKDTLLETFNFVRMIINVDRELSLFISDKGKILLYVSTWDKSDGRIPRAAKAGLAVGQGAAFGNAAALAANLGLAKGLGLLQAAGLNQALGAGNLALDAAAQDVA
ncbi:hypothetical protein BgiBS90_035551 [Biomphalaria glabrata]|nr:hypothetical protein BgiBS90_035551 [Biomphalaria glabrata]